MTKPCKFCKREEVKKLPEKVFDIQCGGKGCGHRAVFGLEDEDCRQGVLDVE